MMLSISFDIAALVVICVLVMSIIFRKMTKGLSNRLFMLSILAEFAASVFDIFAQTVDSVSTAPPFLISFAHTGFMMFHNAQAPLHVFFVISLTDTWHKVRKNNFLKVILALPYSLTFLALLTNPFTGAIFTFQNGYEHSWAFYGVYLFTIPYFAMDFAYIIKYRSQFNFRKILSLSSMMVLVLIAIVIHLMIPEIRVECFAVAISQLIVSVGIQRPEDFIDSFTGFLMHSAYARDMSAAFKNGKHVNIVMLNVGNYEAISNMIGYEAGIQLINNIARRIENITKSIRCSCLCYYLDRGRYRVVFRENDREKAELAAEYIVNDLKMRSRFNGFDINLTPVAVLARCPEEIENFKSLMAFGMDFHEKIPYSGSFVTAKEVYNPEEFEIQNNINKIIERALANRKFEVYYQPIYSTERGKFVSAEALLRLRDDEHGFISPEILIPAAERSGAIHEIGSYVFEEVCRFISSDEFKNLGLDYIEVNLSVAQCMNGDLAENILGIMRKYNVSPDKINLEITETAASFSQRVMMDNLNKLSAEGLEFSLDDYGTGYSNIKRVISLPLKIVKLDKSFVDEQHNPKMMIFLQNTVKMLKDMNIEIVVEGIETIEMVEAFTKLKCDYIQGYYFSRPIRKDDFVKFITASLAEKKNEMSAG